MTDRRNLYQTGQDGTEVMSDPFPTDSFAEAYWEAYQYPSRGKRSSHDGVPTRPTLALFAARAVLEEDPFDSPIRSNSQEVLAIITKLATQSEQSINEIIQEASSKDALIVEARNAVLKTYPEATDVLPENAFSQINYTGPIIVAISAVSYGTDPVEAARRGLDGETLYRQETP